VISPRDLENLKSDAALALTDTCTIIRRTYQSNGQPVDSAPESGVPCLVLSSGQPREEEIASIVQGRQAVKLLLADNVQVGRHDLIKVRGMELEVAGIDPRTNQVLKHVTCILVD